MLALKKVVKDWQSCIKFSLEIVWDSVTTKIKN